MKHGPVFNKTAKNKLPVNAFVPQYDVYVTKFKVIH